MSLDFTYTTLASLLETLSNRGFSFSTLHNFAASSPSEGRVIILRHDVEDDYNKALTFARTEHRMGIMGSYYFRLFPVAANDRIISQIAALGHEVGYHYDDLSVCKGNYKEAITRFTRNVAHLRQFGTVTTITMEGAPRSRFDNRMLWLGRIDKELKASENGASNLKVEGHLSRNQRLPDFYHQLPPNHSKLPHYDYHDFGITTEPYFDLDFNQFFYLTDTGRCWDGWNVSVRDKVPQQEEWVKQGLVFHSTEQIIRAANEGRLPDKIMMTFHPQRWTNNHVFWLKELVLQRLKNVVKRGLVRFRFST